MSETKLKPCPFCGERKEVYLKYLEGSNTLYVDEHGETNSTPLLHTVICTACNATIGKYEASIMAIEAWNRRANDEQIH